MCDKILTIHCFADYNMAMPCVMSALIYFDFHYEVVLDFTKVFNLETLKENIRNGQQSHYSRYD